MAPKPETDLNPGSVINTRRPDLPRL